MDYKLNDGDMIANADEGATEMAGDTNGDTIQDSN